MNVSLKFQAVSVLSNMKKHDTLLIAVVYQGVEPYLSDYFRAVNNQDTTEFDLLLLNHAIPDFELQELSVPCKLVQIPSNITPIVIRCDAISYALKHNYKNIIFSDTDDYFTKNRISTSIEHLKQNDFVFNQLDLVDHSGKLLIGNIIDELSDNKEITDCNQIIDYNFLGLSHTAVQTVALKNFKSPEYIIAFDWWLFTFMLLNGAKGKLINNATTFYRQTDSNLVGLHRTLDETRLQTGLQVKKTHYKVVKDFCNEQLLTSLFKLYSEKYEDMVELGDALKNNQFMKNYIEIVNKNQDYFSKGWWGEILSLKHFKMYQEGIVSC
jgi:hypothetical protein